jgi:hypothetical protein
MAIKRHDARFRLREDILDNITPKVIVQEEIRAPAGHWKPAAWLPVQFTKQNINQGVDAFVCSSGKVVAFDTEGKLVPAGMRTKLGGEGGAGIAAATVLTYTQVDVDWGVIDLTTGEAVAAAVTYTGAELASALIERGLVREVDAAAGGATVPPTGDTDVPVVVSLFISRPVGIAAYDFHVWSGLPEDGDQVFTNFSKQHGVQFLTEVQMKLPHRVAGEETADLFDFATLDGGGSTVYAAGEAVGAGEYWDAANVSQLARYAGILDATSEVVALGLANAPVAVHTDRTPITSDVAGILVRKRTSPDLVSKEGDWYLDADLGVLFLHLDTWTTQVGLTATPTFSYSFYDDPNTVATAHRFVHVDGPVRPGDWLAVDEESNMTKASAAQIAAGEELVGRVLAVESEPRALLKEVKTAWDLAGASAASQMPGSATKGFTDLITLSQEVVADQVVIANIRV